MDTLRFAFFLAVTAVLSGCPLFQDPAAPPAIDRLEASASLEDVFGSMRDNWPEMHVLDNDEREFLLIRAGDDDGDDLTAAYDSSLSLRNDGTVYGRLELTFPVERDGNFILEIDEYSDEEFTFLGEWFTNIPDTNGNPFTGIPANGDVILLHVPSSGSELVVGPTYETNGGSVNNTSNPILIARDPDSGSDPPAELSGFELESSYHLPKDGVSGLVLYNAPRNSTYVVELTDEVAGDVADGTIAGATTYLEDLVNVLEIPDSDPDRVAYTDRGVVAFDYDGEHVVYDIEDGDELARASFSREEEFEYAYAPDGRHWYMLSRERSRLYRMGAWW